MILHINNKRTPFLCCKPTTRSLANGGIHEDLVKYNNQYDYTL